VMVPPHLLPMMEDFKDTGIQFHEMVNDVQSLINIEAMGSHAAQDPRLDWAGYFPTAEIYRWMDEIASSHSAIASTHSYGTSFENRDLRYIQLNKGNTNKPLIVVDANIHAREWITNTIATYLINSLLTGDAAKHLDNFNFVIIPVVNPDGYEYSRNTDRMWRKTRSNLAGGICRGADPNRNFAFGWNTGGSSNQPCSDTYMGVRASSEPEVAALAALLDSLSARTVFYLSLHSYSQLILIPYGTNLGRVPDHAQHMTVGNAAAAAIARRYNTRFTAGNIVELLYVASGASVDYAKGRHDTDLTYTFEMRDTGAYGFILPPAQITPSCLEFMDGFDVILGHLAAKHVAK